ncbi:MAG: xanthine dehydrogenase family protein molybdopterin-binding subunit, partial [Planctomycetes bacterium]|nr:xanthine dehydrogenase family protein molybdopterin-binding subunit [Planctomycetota bacterium]
VHVVTVEVFPDTGDCQILRYIAVDDCGRPVNPTIVRGQIHGGVALGIGNACQEEFVFDEAGNPLTTTLTDYLMVSARDLPHIEVIHHDNPSPHTPLGTKGKGEGPTGMVPGALGNAALATDGGAATPSRRRRSERLMRHAAEASSSIIPPPQIAAGIGGRIITASRITASPTSHRRHTLEVGAVVADRVSTATSSGRWSSGWATTEGASGTRATVE